MSLFYDQAKFVAMIRHSMNVVKKASFYWLYAVFKQKEESKTTDMHRRSGNGHMIDFIITRCWDNMDIHSTRAVR